MYFDSLNYLYIYDRGSKIRNTYKKKERISQIGKFNFRKEDIVTHCIML